MVNLTTQFVGLTLRSPLLVGSAGVTANLELMKRAQDYGAGGVVVKSLFDFVPGRKSPTPRFQLLSRTLNDPRATTLYSIEQGIALDPAGYAEEIARAKRELDIAVIASVDCVQEENWVPYVTTVAQARPDALEINVSCPHGSIAFTGGEVEEAMLRVARRVREAVPYLPLIVKLTGQLTFPPGLVLRLQEMGIEGVTLFNRFTGLEVDLERERPVLHGGYAGHGGAWSLQFGLRWIAALAPQVKLDLSASGGVMSGYDVAKYLLAGATTVQTVSAVYLHGHRIVERFTRELVAFMEAKGYTTVDEFRGRLTDSIVPLERIDRRTRVKVALTRRVEPPCKWACPLGKHVQAFLELVAEGRFAEAYDLLTACDPFPRLTARVCYAPCEEACTRHLADEPLAIRRLERLVADWGWKERQEAARMEELGTGEPRDREHLYPQDKGYRLTGPSLRERLPPAAPRRVAIAGSGPAGLAAAHDLAELGHEVTVFEALPVAGGMLAVGIPDFRLPPEVLEAEIQRLQAKGVRFVLNTRLGREVTLEQLRGDYDAVLIATGAHRSRPLGLPGEEAAGVWMGLDFLRAVNLSQRGLAERPKNLGRVVVLGGGNTAFDAARVALRCEAEEVYVAYRRTREEVPAHPAEIAAAEEEGVRVLYLVQPVRLLKGARDEERGTGCLPASGARERVVGVEFAHVLLGSPEADGRRRPEPLPGSEFVLPADTVIVAVNQEPDTSFALSFTVDPTTLTTPWPGVFAAGDVVEGAGSVAKAIAAGRRAAAHIQRFLAGVELLPRATAEPRAKADPWVVLRRDFERRGRPALPQLAPRQRCTNFEEVERPLAPAAAQAEAQRCLACGCGYGCDHCWPTCMYNAYDLVWGEPVIDRERCDGCGFCAQMCPHGLLEMTPVEEGFPRD